MASSSARLATDGRVTSHGSSSKSGQFPVFGQRPHQDIPTNENASTVMNEARQKASFGPSIDGLAGGSEEARDFVGGQEEGKLGRVDDTSGERSGPSLSGRLRTRLLGVASELRGGREDARAIRERIGYSESAEASRTPVCPRLR